MPPTPISARVVSIPTASLATLAGVSGPNQPLPQEGREISRDATASLFAISDAFRAVVEEFARIQDRVGGEASDFGLATVSARAVTKAQGTAGTVEGVLSSLTGVLVVGLHALALQVAAFGDLLEHTHMFPVFGGAADEEVTF